MAETPPVDRTSTHYPSTTNELQPVAQWGSDAIANFLRSTGIPYLAINPGASYRGLHDSIVNALGATDPHLVLCLHEEHAVAIAHGWAKVTDSPMAVAVHSNVGLMHASMAIYNAWCDRVPMLIIGAHGPLDAAIRRPWIDWIHTSADLAALVRDFVKWDDAPTSVQASLDSLARAWDIARTPPTAPTYVALDVAVQEQRLDGPVSMPVLSDRPVAPVVAAPATVDQARELLAGAHRPLILAGRASRQRAEWDRRIALAEALGARVLTDLKTGAAFPTRHPAMAASPSIFLSEAGKSAIASADVILALDWIDLGGTLAQIPGDGHRVVIDVSPDRQLHRGWAKDGFSRAPADLVIPVVPDEFVKQLLETLPAGPVASLTSFETAATPTERGIITVPYLASTLRKAVGSTPTSLIRLPLAWDAAAWPFDEPLDYLGFDGGGGIGSGPGMVVGAALALRGSGRLPVGIIGDGDFLMGAQAFWTAAHDRIPLLAVVANNRTYFNDEVHQEKIARQRGRDVSRKWVGQRIDDPAPNLAALARAQGLEAFGPITDPAVLGDTLTDAIDATLAGRPTVVDVVVATGYSPTMTTGLTEGGETP